MVSEGVEFQLGELKAGAETGFTHLQTNTNQYKPTYAGWWFGTFFIFPSIGNNHPT